MKLIRINALNAILSAEPLKRALAIAGLCLAFASPSVPATAAPLQLHVSGNTIQDSNNNIVRLQGVNVCGMEFGEGGPQLLTSESTAFGSWHANIMRLPLSQDRWFGYCDGVTDGGAAYRALADSIVTAASNAGCYILADLHWSDVGLWGQAMGQHEMPDQNSTTFWSNCAAHYANNPAVLFDLYNEPHDVAWSVWQNGGSVTEGSSTYPSPGMQGMLNAIRGAGANNVVTCGGLNWAYDLTGVTNGYALTDTGSGHGIVYATHIYPWKGLNAAAWDSVISAAAVSHPIYCGECGADTTAVSGWTNTDVSNWCSSLISWFNLHNYNWTGWCLDDACGPTMISDWNYTPTVWGQIAKNQLTATPPAPPATPAGLVASANTNQVALFWNASSGATSYNVSRSTVSGSGFASLVTDLTVTNYTNTGLTNGTTYYYEVQAVNSGGTSGFSSQASGTPGPNIPAPPTGLTANPGNTQVSLTWNASFSATSYNVSRSTVSGSGYASVATGITVTNYTNLGLTNSTTYYFVVSATNSLGTSANSAQVSGTPVLGIPSPPTGLAATPGNAQVALTWNASGTATSYNVLRSTTSNSNFNTFVYGLSVTNYTDTGLTNGTTYYYEVAATNTIGTSAGCPQVSATPSGGGGPPSAPTGLTATAGNAQAALSWTASSGATSYNVLRSTVNGSGYASVATGITVTNYTNTGLTNGTTYYFVVTATNSNGTSGNSNQASATPVAGGAPPAPTGLTATPGNALVALSWTASSGATSYNALRSTVNGSGYTSVATGISTTSYTNTGLTNGTTYYFVVTATNASGTSGNSNQASATPAAGAPPPPTNLVATVNSTTIQLTFTNSPGQAWYNIWRGTTSGGETLYGTGQVNQPFSDNNMPNGTYYYEVVAVNSAGQASGFSNEASATVGSGGIPPAPTGLAATPGNAQVALSWTASSGATAYDVKRSTVNGSGYVTVSSPTATNYTNTSLTNGTTYYFVVDAKNASGTSGNSAQVSATPVAPPAAPTGLTATPGNAQVVLSWTASSGATSYNVLRSTISGSGYVSVATGISTTTYTNTGLTNGTTYYFVVTAANAGGTSGNSAQASATPTAGGGAPAAPTGLAATAGTAQALLYWTGSTGATSYNISRSTVSGSGYASVATGITVTTYTNTGLTNGTTYYYVVSATNASGTSANSAQSSAKPATGAPGNPTVLTATKNGSTISLTFTVPSGQSWYDVYRGTAPGCETFEGGGQVNQPFSDNNMPNGTYYYKVVSFNSAGIASGFSNEASMTVP